MNYFRNSNKSSITYVAAPRTPRAAARALPDRRTERRGMAWSGRVWIGRRRPPL